ncbi:MAG: hypothetical protein IJM09_00100 [Neisseriaceae bacterium]|nr:hypothetical protein [Neisseriaceae bacterium]
MLFLHSITPFSGCLKVIKNIVLRQLKSTLAVSDLSLMDMSLRDKTQSWRGNLQIITATQT